MPKRFSLDPNPRPSRLPLAAALVLAGFFAVATIAAAPPSKDDGRGASADADVQNVVARFDEAQSRIQTISAHFEEVKTIALLKEPVIQSGEFYHTKPDKFLWEYTSPEPKMLTLNGKDIVAYYPKQKRAEEVHTRFSKRIVKYLGLGSVLKDLVEEYDASISRDNQIAGTDLLVLKPKSRIVAKRISEIRLWVDRQLNQARQIEYIESDGDRSRITFDRILINPVINLTKYEIKLPEDVTVTNGLSGFFTGSTR